MQTAALLMAALLAHCLQAWLLMPVSSMCITAASVQFACRADLAAQIDLTRSVSCVGGVVNTAVSSWDDDDGHGTWCASLRHMLTVVFVQLMCN